MGGDLKVRQRRRAAVSCSECRKHKKRCDRKLPCALCVLRGVESACRYDVPIHPGSSADSAAGVSSSEQNTQPLSHAASRSDLVSNDDKSLTSMTLLKKVISNVDNGVTNHTASTHHPSEPHRQRANLYFNYVRRIPAQAHREALFEHYFAGPNNLHSAIDERIFREQSGRWWTLAYEILPQHGPEALPKELRCFPAIIFHVLAITVHFLPPNHKIQLDELLFGPSHNINDLSEEWAGCGVAIQNLLGEEDVSFLNVQHSLLHDIWLGSTGKVLQSWDHTEDTIRLATSLGLHLEPEVKLSSRAEELLENLWVNEQRKRVWLNLLLWDTHLSMVFGRPAFTSSIAATVTPPLDCSIPVDRQHRVPVGRDEFDPPTPMTERILRYRLTLRIQDVRELEIHQSIPVNAEKVKDLHRFALEFRKNLPPFFQQNPDTRWDEELPYVPVHREMILYVIECFFVALHRPYIMTREKSQQQIFASVMATLDSQDRLEEFLSRRNYMKFGLGLVFPTFDAAMLLAVVMVLYPERYHSSFQRPYWSLRRASERLKSFSSTMGLAKSGAELLETTIRRVVEIQTRSGGVQVPADTDMNLQTARVPPFDSTFSSPSEEHWIFEGDPTIMDWSYQESGPAFDFADIQTLAPLKELVLDQTMDFGDSSNLVAGWTQSQYQIGAKELHENQQAVLDNGENAFWAFLTDDWVPPQ